MPNGGSDNCLTCWFNSLNEGKAGHPENLSAERAYCVIREVTIHYKSSTYCLNHPQHNPAKIDIPMGPIYIDPEWSGARRVWIKSPDTENIRAKLISLLNEIPEGPSFEVGALMRPYEEIIKQVG
ncbi:hypothetical protein ACFL0M_06305 [Thermodesulfobacteriota bacterium]